MSQHDYSDPTVTVCAQRLHTLRDDKGQELPGAIYTNAMGGRRCWQCMRTQDREAKRRAAAKKAATVAP